MARRVECLPGGSREPAASRGTRLRRLVASWAVPGDLDVQVRVARAVLVGGPAVVLLAAGPEAAAVAAGGLVLGGLLASRGADRRRTMADERGLPPLLEAVARRLRAGGSLAQAIAEVPVDADPRCSSLPDAWARATALVPVVGVVAALDDWAASAPASPSVQLASAALAMAGETGGSPARAVDGVASTLRARLAVAEEVRALSSQARASAAVIALAPLAFGTLTGLTDDRTLAFLTTPHGLALLTAGLALDAAGAWWMSRLCRMGS
ncbi:MAG TPA: hypothetical protein VM933_05780 [Acidimicrobiales bacterium]|nr:hypothetical protein [Acidimicrobiales bacterium]